MLIQPYMNIFSIANIILIQLFGINDVDGKAHKLKKSRINQDLVETAGQKSNRLQNDLQSLAAIIAENGTR